MEKSAVVKLDTTIIENIDSLLEKTGKKQKDLAAALGIDEETFKKRKYRIKNQRRAKQSCSFTIYELSIISDFFEVPLLSLLIRKDRLIEHAEKVDCILEQHGGKANYDFMRRFIFQSLPCSNKAPRYLYRHVIELAKATSKYVRSGFFSNSIGILEWDQDQDVRKYINLLSKKTEEIVEFNYYIRKLETYVFWIEVYNCAQRIAAADKNKQESEIYSFVKTAEKRTNDFHDLLGFFKFKIDSIVDSPNEQLYEEKTEAQEDLYEDDWNDDYSSDEEGATEDYSLAADEFYEAEDNNLEDGYSSDEWKYKRILFNILNIENKSDDNIKIIVRTLKTIFDFTGVSILPDIVGEYTGLFVYHESKGETIKKMVKSIKNRKLSHAISVAFDLDTMPETKTKKEARQFLENEMNKIKSATNLGQKTEHALNQLFANYRFSDKVISTKWCVNRLLSAKQSRFVHALCDKAYNLNIFETEIPIGRLFLRIPAKKDNQSEFWKEANAKFIEDLKKLKFTEPVEPFVEYLISQGVDEQHAVSQYEQLRANEPEKRKRGRPRKKTDDV